MIVEFLQIQIPTDRTSRTRTRATQMLTNTIVDTTLLTTSTTETDVDKECEDTVNRVIRDMELLSQCTDVEEITREEIGTAQIKKYESRR